VKTKFIITILSAVLTSFMVWDVNAQSRYFNEGQSGTSIGGGMGSEEYFSEFSANFCYTFVGRFDVQLGISQASFNEEDFGKDLSAILLPVEIDFAILRPSENYIGGIDLKARYVNGRFSGDILEYKKSEMTSDTYSAGMELYLKLKLSQNSQVLPAVSVSYAKVTPKIENSIGYSIEEETEGVLISASAALLINSNFVIRQSITNFQNSSSWSIHFQFIIPV